MTPSTGSGQAPAPPPVSKRRAWWLALRPFSYPASIVPVLVGTAIALRPEPVEGADDAFRPGLFLLAFAGGILIHAGCNLATDFFDFVDGVQPRASLGNIIRTGVIDARSIHRAAIACFVAGSACGFVIVAYVGWPILVAGFFSVLAAYFYTATPIAYGRRGLGEVMVFFFMGPLMVMASYYVQLEVLTWEAFIASLPVGLLVANILHANNLRDIENDRAARKVTISTIIGRPAADFGIWAFVVAAYAVVLAGIALDELPLPCLVVLASLPWAWTHIKALQLTDPVALNLLVRTSAGLHMRFGLLLAMGCLAGAL